MEAQKRIDKVLTAAQKKVEGEVGALIGHPFALNGSLFQPVSKEDFFDSLSGRQILAKMDITGEINGLGCLVVGLKDAIRLGGTLIMLPPSELEEVVAREEYNEDTEDSFGEIANIIAGSYTKVFEEMYPQSCRFIRKEQENILPVKVVVDSDEPVSNQIYYQISATMALGDKQMGDMFMLIPASSFGLAWEDAPVKKPAETAGWPEKQQNAEKSPVLKEADNHQQAEEELTTEETEAVATETVEPEQVEETKEDAPAFDVEKHRKRVDRLLKDCQEKMEEEVGALLGCDVKLQDLENRLISKEEFFFDEVMGKQVVANMDVAGEIEGAGYFFVGLKDAIFIGGTLIMLPQSELESVVGEEAFGDDTQDAYGEIANIIAGVYSGIFEEQYIKRIRFVKTGIEQIVPMKVTIDSEQPIANERYYMSTMSMTIAGKKLGKVRMLLPSRMLQLDEVEKKEAPVAAPAEVKKPALAAKKDSSVDQKGAVGGVRDVSSVAADILVISDDELEAAKLIGVLEERGYQVRHLTFKDNVHNHISGELRAVYLVMREVNEQTFGMAIKVSSSCRVPLIAAGPAWTKSKVFKAVKYGVGDILLTPATREDIVENVENNLVKLAA
jgi:chemotaxis protein CheY-P-specific phosphatase CheC